MRSSWPERCEVDEHGRRQPARRLRRRPFGDEHLEPHCSLPSTCDGLVLKLPHVAAALAIIPYSPMHGEVLNDEKTAGALSRLVGWPLAQLVQLTGCSPRPPPAPSEAPPAAHPLHKRHGRQREEDIRSGDGRHAKAEAKQTAPSRRASRIALQVGRHGRAHVLPGARSR